MFEVTYVALWILVAVLYCAVFLLYRYLGEAIASENRKVESGGPRLGVSVDVKLETTDGRSVEIGKGTDGYVLMFSAPECKACREMLPSLREGLGIGSFHGRHFVLVHHGERESAPDYTQGIPGDILLISDPHRKLARQWGVHWTPYFVSIGPGGVVGWKGTSLEDLKAVLASDAAMNE